jgi:hypothetical protein
MQPEYYLSMYAVFNSNAERQKFFDENIRPFAGVEKPIFSVSRENESCSTQELLELKVCLKEIMNTPLDKLHTGRALRKANNLLRSK